MDVLEAIKRRRRWSPMDVLEAIKRRRSIRAFKSQNVSEEIVKKLN